MNETTLNDMLTKVRRESTAKLKRRMYNDRRDDEVALAIRKAVREELAKRGA